MYIYYNPQNDPLNLSLDIKFGKYVAQKMVLPFETESSHFGSTARLRDSDVNSYHVFVNVSLESVCFPKILNSIYTTHSLGNSNRLSCVSVCLSGFQNIHIFTISIT